MADSLKEIITKLERQRNAIDRALTALHDIEGAGAAKTAAAPVAVVKATRKRRKGRITEEGRKRLAEAMKKRWAIKRSAGQAKKATRKKAAAA